METKAAIQAAMDLSMMVFKSYVDDLEDAELLLRPGPGCNHLAWQMGHLISSEANLLDSICPGKAPALPEGFAAAHSKQTADSDDPEQFPSKSEYLSLFEQVRGATVAALQELPDEQLDAPVPEHLRDFVPTLGHVFILIGTHPMMHSGQAVPLRRKLNKPILF